MLRFESQMMNPCIIFQKKHYHKNLIQFVSNCIHVLWLSIEVIENGYVLVFKKKYNSFRNVDTVNGLFEESLCLRFMCIIFNNQLTVKRKKN